MKHEIGYHFIEHLGKLIPARWDGKNWHSEHGQHVDGNPKKKFSVVALGCPAGCSCSTNGDGSVTVSCGSPKPIDNE